MVSEKAEQYINNQTAKRVLSMIVKDVLDLGRISDMDDDAKVIAKRIEDVRDKLIGV